MFIYITLSLLLILILAIILLDLIPLLRDWLNRIHIGRIKDKENWSYLITQVGIKWLNNTPKIKVTDNTRLVAIDMLKGNYTKSAIQQWQEAALLLGMIEYLKNHKDEKVEKEIQKYFRNKFDKEGRWIKKPHNIDNAILAYAIMKTELMETDKYKKALDYTWQLIQEHIGEDGTVGYRKSMEDYRYVDTIGFICPFLIAYGLRYEKNECIELAVKQIKEYEKHAMLDNHYIPSHAYKVENKTPVGLYGWGRGLGWYAIGLIDSWNELPESSTYKKKLEESVIKFTKAIITFQQENGGWNWTVTRSESRPDSSTTAALAWFLLNASKINEITEDCLISTNRAMSYLMSVTRRKGAVDFSQGDTKDIGVYSMLFGILPFTQGFSIRLINFEGLEKS